MGEDPVVNTDREIREAEQECEDAIARGDRRRAARLGERMRALTTRGRGEKPISRKGALIKLREVVSIAEADTSWPAQWIAGPVGQVANRIDRGQFNGRDVAILEGSTGFAATLDDEIGSSTAAALVGVIAWCKRQPPRVEGTAEAAVRAKSGVPRDPVIAAAAEMSATRLALNEALARRDATAVEQHRTTLDALARQAALAAPTTRDGALRKLVEIAELAECVPDDAAQKVRRTIMQVLRELMRYRPRPGDGHILRRAILHAASLAPEVRAPIVDAIAGLASWYRNCDQAGSDPTPAGHPAPFTIDALSAELRVNRRSIERAIEAGAIVPTSPTASGRARFSAEYVECLKARVAAARFLGHKRVMGSLGLPPERPRRNAAQFVEQLLWKYRHLHRRAAP